MGGRTQRQTQDQGPVGATDADASKDPTQIALPDVDNDMKLLGKYNFQSLLGSALVGGALWIPAMFYYAATGNGNVARTVFLAGAAVSAICMTVTVSTDYRVTTPTDRIRGEIAYRKRQFSLPWTLDDLSGGGEGGAEPIHGYRRFMSDGTGKMVGGRYVRLVRINGRSTERLTEAESNTLIRTAASGIRRYTPQDQPFTTFTTTFEMDPSTITSKYEAQLDGGRWNGAKWRYARELIHDVIDYEQKESAAWDPRETRTYQIISVSEHELQSRQTTTVGGPITQLRDWYSRQTGSGSSYHDLPRYKRKQLRKKLNERERAAISTANATDGVTAEPVGPGEHALVVSKYWSGVDGGKHFSDARAVTDAVNLAVWPAGPSGGDGGEESGHPPANPRDPDADGHAHDRDHLPVGAARYIDGHDHIEQRDVVGGVDDVGTASALADLDAAVANATESARSDVQSPRAADAGHPDDVDGLDGQDAEVASIFAKVREGLLRPLGMDADSQDQNQDQDAESVGEPSPIEMALAPHHYHEGKHHAELGDQYVRTFWLKDWPKTAPSNFLKALLTKRGVDFDVKLFAHPIHTDDAIARLEQEMDKIGAEVEDSEERQDHDAEHMVEDKHYYQAMYKLLKDERAVRAWDMNGYITIRVGHSTALAELADQIDDGVAMPTEAELDIAKLDALNEIEEFVRDKLEDERVGMTVLQSFDRHDDLIRSAAPGAPDVYQFSSKKNRGTMVLTGEVAAAFPYCRDLVHEPEGTEYGRSLEHGGKIMASQHDRGAAPHKLTIADSGSGKSYLVTHQAVRWWIAGQRPKRHHPNESKLSDPAVDWLYSDDHGDRTVIFVDTMGGFEAPIRALNGNHIPVDGNTNLNPLEIHSSDSDERSDAIDSFEMGFAAANSWLLDIIEAEGGNADDYKPLVKDVLLKTYKRAGIHPKKPETHRRELSPNMGDFLDTLREYHDHAEEETLLDLGGEADQIRDEIKSLARRLTGFKPGGDYANMANEGDVRIEPGQLNYIDLNHIEGSGTADEAVTLPLILRYIYEAVKSSPGDTKVVIDEAHYLLHSPRIRQWLQQSARHWRHHRAGLWFLTHRPEEFISGDSDEDGHKDAIRAQCNTIEFMRTKDIEWSDARDYFDMNWNIYQFVKNEAVTGEDEEGYTNGAVFFRDRPGWHTFELKAGPFEHALLSWKEKYHGDLEPYLDRFASEDPLSPQAVAEERRQLFERAKREAKEELQAEAELADARRRAERPQAQADGGSDFAATEQDTTTETETEGDN